MKNLSVTFVTSCDLNFINHAIVLSQSVKENFPESNFILGLNEFSSPLVKKLETEIHSIDRILCGEELHPSFPELHNRYGIVELTCSTKPNLIRKALDLGSDLVVYLDADSFVVAQFLDLIVECYDNNFDLVMTPHLTQLGNFDMEVSTMRHGVMNLGFLIVNNKDSTKEFLSWWNARLERFCLRDYHMGIFTDQSWAALALGTLKVHINRDLGVNLGTWRLADFEFSKIGHQYFVNDSALRLIHFSGFENDGIGKFVEKYNYRKDSVFDEILTNYREKMESVSQLTQHINFVPYEKRILYKSNFRRKFSYNIARIRFIDYLGANLPTLLKFFMRIKRILKAKQ